MQLASKYLSATVGALLITGALTSAVSAQRPSPGDAWLGLGIACSDCGSQQMADHTTAWFFSASPVVVGLDASGPAARAGLRAGDLLTQIDGVALTTPDGGRRFGRLAVGQTIVLTYMRSGVVRTARLTTGAHATEQTTVPAAPPDTFPIRFEGGVGDVAVDVRGGKVTVAIDEQTGEVLIRGADLAVRLRPKSGGNEKRR
jgi:membrane-associated protease RseP (regulator of RpoE activity)